ncbi:MAG TPA: glycosyltransferase [Terriglobales bacterium]
MNTIQVPAPRMETPVSDATRPLRVLTLTPFYPSVQDPAQGCFIAEPLVCTERLRIANEVIAVEPFYRRRLSALQSSVSSQWRSYFSLPGNFGLASAGSFLAARLSNAVRGLHRQMPFDLIHAHSALPCGQAAAALSRNLGIPFVVSVHGLDTFSTRQVGKLWANWCHQKSTQVYRRARAIICISEKVKQQLTSEIAAKAVVIYNGVDANVFTPATETQPTLTVLSVGNLIPIKGHALLLRAFADVISYVPNARLEIVGEGCERERLVNLANALEISKRVSFIGRQNRDGIAQAMQRCAVFALPSSYEGLGCVYLEAMASGKPAIGCREQGIDEVIEHGKNGLLISLGNQAELVESLRVTLQNEDFRRRMGTAAREAVLQAYTLEHQAHRFAQLYRECVQ